MLMNDCVAWYWRLGGKQQKAVVRSFCVALSYLDSLATIWIFAPASQSDCIKLMILPM